MALKLFEAGDPATLCRLVESHLSVLRSSDHGRSPVGLNETGLKAVVIAALHDAIAAGGAIMSEVKTGGGGIADLVVTWPNRDELVVIELKHVPAGYCASTEKKSESALTNRDAIQRQIEYLKSLSAADMERMLVTTGARVASTVSKLIDAAFAQAKRNAAALTAGTGKRTVPIAIVGVGPRVLHRTG